MTEAEYRSIVNQQRRLPTQIEAARTKLAHLIIEAERNGMAEDILAAQFNGDFIAMEYARQLTARPVAGASAGLI